VCSGSRKLDRELLRCRVPCNPCLMCLVAGNSNKVQRCQAIRMLFDPVAGSTTKSLNWGDISFGRGAGGRMMRETYFTFVQGRGGDAKPYFSFAQGTPVSRNYDLTLHVQSWCAVSLLRYTSCKHKVPFRDVAQHFGRDVFCTALWSGHRAQISPGGNSCSTNLSGSLPILNSDLGPVFGRFSVKLGPKTPLERRGSSCSAGCTKNQPPRPILRPFRGNSEFGNLPLQ
jgi:hypothetical protein